MFELDRVATSEWANPDEVAAQHPFKPGAFWLGRSPAEPPVPLGYLDDRHVCLVSGSRGGKGTSVIINNLCLWEGSLVCIDPKGENATVTAARRGPGSEFCEGMGQAVHVLDPFEAAKVDPSLRSRFNPLEHIDPHHELAPDEVGRIAEALVVSSNSSDPYWDNSARTMLKTIILHVLTSPHFKGHRNLITVRRLITHGDERFFAEMEQDPVLQTEGRKTPSARELLWVGIANNGQHDGKISGQGMLFLETYRHSKPHYESVLQVVSRNTEFLDSTPMQRCLAASDFKLSELKTREEGMSLYLSLPQRYMADHFRWLRMMVTLVANEMEATPGRPAKGHPVLVCLDEFAGLKRMEAIENAVAQIAGFGVKLFFCLQSLEQLKGTYPDKWQTFLSNCGLKLFFNVEDHFSRDEVVKLAGETEIIRTTQSGSENVVTTTSTTTNTGGSVADTTGDSRTHSTNSSSSHGTASSKSRNWGGSRSTGTSKGTSVAHNWGLNPILFRTTSQFLSLLRQDETTNRGSSGGTNTNKGESWGGGNSFSENTGTAHGTGEAVTHNTGKTVTTTTGTAIADGKSTGTTGGWSDGVHKRPLITTDELGFHFSAIRDPKAKSYPGLALVLASGQRPLAIRRANYFEDDEFIGCFDAHPDHPDSRPPPLWRECPVLVPEEAGLAALWEVCPAATPLMLDAWLATEGEATGRGRPLARLKIGWRQTPADRPKWFTAELLVPFSGTLARLACEPGELQPDQELAFIRLNRRKAHLERAEPLPDCIEELVGLLAAENARAEETARRTEHERREEAANLEWKERDRRERVQALEERKHAHFNYQLSRCRGFPKLYLTFGKLPLMLSVGSAALMCVSFPFVLMAQRKGLSQKLDGLLSGFLFSFALLAVTGGLYLFLEWLLGRPRNPLDNPDARVSVQPDGSLQVTPLAPDGSLSPGEALAFVKTAFVHPRLISGGVQLHLPSSQACGEVELGNLALLLHAANINRLKVTNQTEVESHLRGANEVVARAKLRWKDACRANESRAW